MGNGLVEVRHGLVSRRAVCMNSFGLPAKHGTKNDEIVKLSSNFDSSVLCIGVKLFF